MFVDPLCPPYLGVCGLQDAYVPPSLYEEFEDKLIAVGVTNSFETIYLDAGHGYQDSEFNPEAWNSEDTRLDTVDFFIDSFALNP